MSCLREEEVIKRDIREELTTGGRCYLGSVEESDDVMTGTRTWRWMVHLRRTSMAEAWDDVDGEELDLEVMRKARDERSLSGKVGCKVDDEEELQQKRTS